MESPVCGGWETKYHFFKEEFKYILFKALYVAAEKTKCILFKYIKKYIDVIY